MVNEKSLDEYVVVITALLHDVQTLCSDVFSKRAERLTVQKIIKRSTSEGSGFFTKTLPRLCKAFDRALTGDDTFDASSLGFKPYTDSKLPIFLGELFARVMSHDGKVLKHPCTRSIQLIRMVTLAFYKYKLPYSVAQTMDVITAFQKAEYEIQTYNKVFCEVADLLDSKAAVHGDLPDYSVSHESEKRPSGNFVLLSRAMSQIDPWLPLQDLPGWQTCEGRLRSISVIRRARAALNELFLSFDPLDIYPKHGPGAVSTKEKLWFKYTFRNVSPRITQMWPLDAYYYASTGHVCDEYRNITISQNESSAKVVLVPKDSRGPRLISCEPLDFQWIQQGLGKAIVDHVEQHPLTRYSVRFTNQQTNQFGALLGSVTGEYSTLDLKEASDRVTVGLVRLLFPSKVVPYLLAARSLSTVLPSGERIYLSKYAPMGSALCFPVLALTVWAILYSLDEPQWIPGSSSKQRCCDEDLAVYGDDVIVKTAKAARAIEQLELFGLKVNQHKSCVSGFFRESCGVDAYQGVRVTPVYFRQRLPSLNNSSPESYCAWISYANSLYERSCHHTFKVISEILYRIYGTIPSKAQCTTAPHLYETPDTWRPLRKRWNVDLQKSEYLVLSLKAQKQFKIISGWKMLLRWFSEHPNKGNLAASHTTHKAIKPLWVSGKEDVDNIFISSGSPLKREAVGQYTERRKIKLLRCWR